MSKLADHIDDGNWHEFFNEDEIGHVLTFIYNLIKWIERDEADMLEQTSTKFIWSKGKQIVGTFPINVPEPVPSFTKTLLDVLDRDDVVQQHLNVTYDGAGSFRINHK